MPSLKKRHMLQAVPQGLVQDDGTIFHKKHQEISIRAYALYERRGRLGGFELQDWLQAELEILTEDSIH